MKVRVYVEGGGKQRKTLDDCRRGFGQLFHKIVQDGHQPKVIACGGRDSTFGDFQRDLRNGRVEFLILLVDSEESVSKGVTSWDHLRARQDDQWECPPETTDDQAHLMVQCMESWFLADRDTLRQYYGKEFLMNSLPGQPNVEEISKRDVERALQHASQRTQKGPYHKTGHGFALLAEIDPTELRKASPRARRLFEVLEARARM